MITEALFLLLFFFLFLSMFSVFISHTFLRVAMEGGREEAKGVEGFIYRFESSLFRLFPRMMMDMSWKQYGLAVILMHGVSFLFLFMLFRSQSFMGLGPEVSPLLALNIAISFVTNTNWQPYNSELTLNPVIMTVGIIPVMFISSATGVSIAFAMIRALTKTSSLGRIGNFFLDLIRSSLYVLLPLSLIGACLLTVGGVPSSLPQYKAIPGSSYVALEGPIAAFTAIELLGGNGGGFYTANVAHPLQNPSPLSHVFELFLMFLLPSSFIFALGRALKQPRFASLLFIGLSSIVIFSTLSVAFFESASAPINTQSLSLTDALLEGKEVRFGSFWSSFWAIAATATSCGASSVSFGSLQPLSVSLPLGLMQTGEVIFGGVGLGCVGIIFYMVLAAFTSGLMVGRTPEIFHKKIAIQEIILIVGFLAAPLILILGAVIFYVWEGAIFSEITSSPLRSVTEVIYAMTSCVSNNGSAIASLKLSHPSLLLITSLCMWLGRISFIIIALVFAGLLSQKKIISENSTTVHIDTILFISWFVLIIIGVGLLSYLPFIVMGPLFEQFHTLEIHDVQHRAYFLILPLSMKGKNSKRPCEMFANE